jgi:exodeoxyribonuclease V alpha subunit
MAESIDVHKVFAEYFKGCETLAYALSGKLAEGNICLDIDKYKEKLPSILEEQMAKESYSEKDSCFWVSPEDFEEQCKNEQFVTHSGTELKPFVILNGNAYLHRYFQYETQIIENIRRLGDKFRIITGGPGTGKTYSVSKKLLEMFGKDIHIKVALAAPTGKAAARMNEAIKDFANNPENQIEKNVKDKLTGLKAQTIHRLLGYKSDSVYFKHDENNQLPYDVVIIDECSMIDGALMAKLLNAINDKTRLYLLGDKDQLASVEAGSVFGDICRAKDSTLLKEKLEIETESRRFDSNKGIGKLSIAIIEGRENDILNFDNNDKQIEIDYSYSKEKFENYAYKYLDYINEPDVKESLKKINQIRFLCAVREGEQGIEMYNKKIEKYLKNKTDDISKFDPKPGFYHNQPILITQNNYDLNIFNGDVGLIRIENGVLYAFFDATDGEIRKILPGYLNNFETVFAMTIHKSQGSEFDNVVVILPEKYGQSLLTRELLYTAVTRAKINVLLQTSQEVLKKCVEKSVSRASGIEERINNFKY